MMSPSFSEDEIDDLLYFARTGDDDEFEGFKEELCKREGCTIVELAQNARDEGSGNGILHMAAANGHHGFLRKVCKQLSSHGGPQNPIMLEILNRQNSAGNTALHWAALNGHLEAVKLLLEEGVDPTIANGRGYDAIYEAEVAEKKDIVEWILKEGGEGLETGLGGDGGDEDNGDGEDVEVVMNEGDLKGMEKEMEGIDISQSGEKR